MPCHLNTFASKRCCLRPSGGFSLVELMISVTIGILIVLGLTTIYSGTSRTNRDMTQMNLQIENGRAAQQILAEDLSHAGFWDRFAPDPAVVTALPDPCLGFSTPWADEDIDNRLAIGTSSLDTPPGTCDTVLTDKKADSDVLVVRHADTCSTGEVLTGGGNCPGLVATEVYFQAICNSPPDRPTVAKTGFSTTTPSCAPAGSGAFPIRRYISNIYYIRDGNPPALMRSSFVGGVQTTPDDDDVLIEGIESLVVEYGIDSAGNDGTVDQIVRCTAAAPCSATTLSNAVTATLHILSRNLEPRAGHNDTKTYNLGDDVELGPFNDSYLRNVYSTTVRLTNISIRRSGS